MLQRARRLSSIFDQYYELNTHSEFKLNAEEWRQVNYLLYITQPFYKFTTRLSQTKDTTVHNIFRVYNQLFDHLDVLIRRLGKKKVPWKQAMLHSLEVGRDKLKFYYAKTEEIHGNLYAIGTILAPQHKLQFFSGGEYSDDIESRATYKAYLERFLEPYQKPIPKAQRPQRLVQQKSDDMEDLFDEVTPVPHQMNTNNELTEYLGTSK